RGGYYPLTSGGAWDRHGFVRYAEVPSVKLQDAQVKLVDLDGDGVVDALRTGTNFELFYNDPRVGWDRVEVRQRAAGDIFPDVNVTDIRVRLGDMTGDGLQDIVMVSNRRIDYWPYVGHGRWAKRITMRNSPTFEDAASYGADGYDPKRVLLGDVDGDGC